MTAVSVPSPSPRPPLWKQFSNFTNNSPAGLEKFLRLLQALSQIIAEISVTIYSSPALAVQCSVAKGQLALARRYFRFFKFIDSFEHASTALSPSNGSGSAPSGLIGRSVEVGKWSCFGLYFLLEDSTIFDAMGIWTTTWSRDVLLEANRFWFYALALSLMQSIWTVFSISTSTPSASEQEDEKTSEKKNRKQQPVQPSRKPLIKKIIIDGCDILIPGSATSWIGASPAQVGVAMVVSTLVASQDIWIKAQG